RGSSTWTPRWSASPHPTCRSRSPRSSRTPTSLRSPTSRPPSRSSLRGDQEGPPMTTVTMPQLGETVVEGTILRWLKREGETVALDEPLLEISTDKVDTEVPSPAAGVLTKILVPEGHTVAVKTPLAEVEEVGAGGQTGEAVAPSGAAQVAAAGAPADTAASAGAGGAGPESAPAPAPAPMTPTPAATSAPRPGGLPDRGPGAGSPRTTCSPTRPHVRRHRPHPPHPPHPPRPPRSRSLPRRRRNRRPCRLPRRRRSRPLRRRPSRARARRSFRSRTSEGSSQST